MKLRETNKADNRRFHELSPVQRTEFLERAYSEIFSTDPSQRGEFTPVEISSEFLGRQLSRDQIDEIHQTVHKLNFLMTRFNMEGKPEYQERVRNLALLRFEYQFLLGDTEYCQDPGLVGDFFTKRGKPELIRPVLARMGMAAVQYGHLAERIIDHPVFQEHLGPEAALYKFRSRLHVLVHGDHYSKEQAVGALMDEGFDPIALEFNRWYRNESDHDVRTGRKPYRRSAKEDKWLADFVAGKRAGEDSAPLTSEGTALAAGREEEDEEGPEEKFECSKRVIEAFDNALQKKAADPNNAEALVNLAKLLRHLTSDHSDLRFDSGSVVEAVMWDHLWGGRFDNLAYQLKGANADGKTRRGLNYNRWALTHDEHRRSINPILAQDSYAMIIAGDILVGDLVQAQADFNDPQLAAYKHSDKIKAAVNLAWELMQYPGQSDDQDEYVPPKAYLFETAEIFSDFLGETKSAAPYLKLAAADFDAGLPAEEKAILAAIFDLEAVERVYNKLGMADQIKARFLEIFDKTFDRDTEFIASQSEVRGIAALIQDQTFRRYVDDAALTEQLSACVQGILGRKSKYDSAVDARGAKKLVLTLYQNSLLHPYLAGRIDISAMLNGMIDDLVDHGEDLLTVPYSLRDQGELALGPDEAIEAYMIADRLRSYVDPARMQRLVAYLLALNCELSVHDSIDLSSLVIDQVGQQADPNYQRPEFFPEGERNPRNAKVQFVTGIFERELELGGLNWETASIGVSNVIYRGTYVAPGRFYPRLDAIMGFLNSPVAQLLPKEGLGLDAVKEFRILRDFLQG